MTLSGLFEAGKDTLPLYSLMFLPGPSGVPLEAGCPSCTSIIDAIDGEVPISQRINFAVVARAPIDRFRAHADSRGWRHARLLSSAHTTYNRDYQAETPTAARSPWPPSSYAEPARSATRGAPS